MTTINSFAPQIRADARILILGSMPGAASLAAGQYYAHPRNAFWPIVCAWCGISPEIAYANRISAMHDARIGVWDVLASCQRLGSLDSAITRNAAQPNDLMAVLQRCPTLERVCFNGAAAAAFYRRQRYANGAVELLRLPSTSPAHTMPIAEKMRLWHKALRLYQRATLHTSPTRNPG